MSLRIPFRLALALALLAAPLPAAAELTRPERTMIATVDGEQARTLAMLEKWVNQNSGSLNLEGVTRVGEMLRAELEPLGFKVDWIDMKATGRAGHIIARSGRDSSAAAGSGAVSNDRARARRSGDM